MDKLDFLKRNMFVLKDPSRQEYENNYNKMLNDYSNNKNLLRTSENKNELIDYDSHFLKKNITRTMENINKKKENASYSSKSIEDTQILYNHEVNRSIFLIICLILAFIGALIMFYIP